jgi:hypothetical protein
MRLVLVIPMKHFDDFVMGEPRWVYMDERVANLIVSQYLHLVWDPAWNATS